MVQLFLQIAPEYTPASCFARRFSIPLATAMKRRAKSHSPDLLITGCAELVTLRGPVPRRGPALADLGIIRDGALLIRDGRIAAAGVRRRIENLREARSARKLDLGGRVVLPGFVDSHTHLVFAASRANEYEMRIAGATYEEIARAGGGIVSSVRNLRRASPAELKARALANLAQFAAHGTTTIEAKSGYGLDWASERKTLLLLRELEQDQPIEILRTFLGAHVVPPEFKRRADEYVELVCRKWIPQVARENLAEYCDAFCDRGAFTVAQTRKILTAARSCGLGLRIHAEQLASTGAARLAVELHAASADHLEQL